MADPLRDKAALVTGAGRGIGRACALTAASAGAAVVLAARTLEEIEAVAEEVRRGGGRALPVPTDVSKEEEVERLVREALGAFGAVDILINAAAIDGPRCPVEEVELSRWERTLAVNLTGVFLCCRAVIPLMRARGKGCIINIGSRVGQRATPGAVTYSVTKWGLEGFTKGLAKEVEAYGIRVYCLSPGLVHTRTFPARDLHPERRAEIRQPEDIREALLFLLTEPGATPTGSFLHAPDWERERGIKRPSPAGQEMP